MGSTYGLHGDTSLRGAKNARALVDPRARPPSPKRVVGERARRWARMLDEGVYSTRAALARGEGVSRAAVTQAPRGRGRGRLGQLPPDFRVADLVADLLEAASEFTDLPLADGL